MFKTNFLQVRIDKMQIEVKYVDSSKTLKFGERI